MLAASGGLVLEAIEQDIDGVHPTISCTVGLIIGAGLVSLTQQWLEHQPHLHEQMPWFHTQPVKAEDAVSPGLAPAGAGPAVPAADSQAADRELQQARSRKARPRGDSSTTHGMATDSSSAPVTTPALVEAENGAAPSKRAKSASRSRSQPSSARTAPSTTAAVAAAASGSSTGETEHMTGAVPPAVDAAALAWRRTLLLIGVMTVHSFAEGVGIGVAWGTARGASFGPFVSLSLGLHNIPEGLATALVLLPKGASPISTALWCIVTSIPQPIMAVPAYFAVTSFAPWLPAGLGFAAGAMAWVASFDLIPEALEQRSKCSVAGWVLVSGCFMAAMQWYLH